ncbi:MAG: hypothetical protein ACR2NP_15455, partial [Pirellulaceae bacterium]
MNSTSPRDIVLQHLRDKGFNPAQVDQIMARLDEHDRQIQTDNLFIAVAEGNFDLGDVVQEVMSTAVEPLGIWLLLRKEQDRNENAMIGEIIKIGSAMPSEGPFVVSEGDMVLAATKNAISVSNLPGQEMFAVPFADVAVR